MSSHIICSGLYRINRDNKMEEQWSGALSEIFDPTRPIVDYVDNVELTGKEQYGNDFVKLLQVNIEIKFD